MSEKNDHWKMIIINILVIFHSREECMDLFWGSLCNS